VSAQFQVSAEARINPDSMGNSLSVGIRLFELKDLTEFSKLTPEAANSDKTPAELFGPALVSYSEFTAVPGETAPRTEALQPGAKFLAIVALYRKPDPQFWRVVVPADSLRKSKGKAVVVHVNANKLTVTGAPLQLLPGQPDPGKS
jgi:type VI secretion system protein VasD